MLPDGQQQKSSALRISASANSVYGENAMEPTP
jgi:hypothetical protein